MIETGRLQEVELSDAENLSLGEDSVHTQNGRLYQAPWSFPRPPHRAGYKYLVSMQVCVGGV